MVTGFRVDLGALTSASQGIDGVLYDVANNRVGGIKVDTSVAGHERLAESVAEFCDRWDRGVGNLAEDGRAVADRLRASVAAYVEVEHATAGVFDSPGPDPAGN